MKAKVDAALCVGTGSCVAMCPEVFQLNDEGISEVQVDPVPANLEESCRKAAAACPVEAITIE